MLLFLPTHGWRFCFTTSFVATTFLELCDLSPFFCSMLLSDLLLHSQVLGDTSLLLSQPMNMDTSVNTAALAFSSAVIIEINTVPSST